MFFEPTDSCFWSSLKKRKQCFLWDTLTSRQGSNCDGVVLEIYLDRKFQEGSKKEILSRYGFKKTVKSNRQ